MTISTASVRRTHVTAPQAAQGGWHPAAWLAELAGTAIMMLGGLSAVVLDFCPGSPMACAVVAALVWRYVPRDILTAKLFHGPRYRSSLAWLLPVRQERAATPPASGERASG